jgi:serine phosphatase RsbU (regulator of sigma subunit)
MMALFSDIYAIGIADYSGFSVAMDRVPLEVSANDPRKAPRPDTLTWGTMFKEAYMKDYYVTICFAPYYNFSVSSRDAAGFLGVNISLDHIGDIVRQAGKWNDSGTLVFLMNNEGKLVFCSDDSVNPSSLDGRNPSDDLSVLDANLLPETGTILENERGFFQYKNSSGELSYVAYRALPRLNGVRAVQFDGSTINRRGEQFKEDINAITAGAEKKTTDSFIKALLLLLLFASPITAGCVFLALRAAASIETITAEKERASGELAIASDIQQDVLPHIEPDFSGCRSFDLYAQSLPAKEVGGDFYDFFYLDEERSKICLVIADVSGKGIPAALFMMTAKTLLKQNILTAARARSDRPRWFAEAMEEVNRNLCEHNERCMFVTVFAAAVDLESGGAVCVNAGHNFPLLSQEGRAFGFFEGKKSMIMGVYDDTVYQEDTLRLSAGDKIVLYTDGFNEAMNEREEEFGNERLLAAAESGRGLSARALDSAIRAAVAAFTGGVEQSDDITALVFDFKG